MSSRLNRKLQMPRRDDLGLLTIANSAGLSISALPNGALFSIDYVDSLG